MYDIVYQQQHKSRDSNAFLADGSFTGSGSFGFRSFRKLTTVCNVKAGNLSTTPLILKFLN